MIPPNLTRGGVRALLRRSLGRNRSMPSGYSSLIAAGAILINALYRHRPDPRRSSRSSRVLSQASPQVASCRRCARAPEGLVTRNRSGHAFAR